MTNKKMTPAATEKQREFGALLKEIRQKAGLSQKKMGHGPTLALAISYPQSNLVVTLSLLLKLELTQ